MKIATLTAAMQLSSDRGEPITLTPHDLRSLLTYMSLLSDPMLEDERQDYVDHHAAIRANIRRPREVLDQVLAAVADMTLGQWLIVVQPTATATQQAYDAVRYSSFARYRSPTTVRIGQVYVGFLAADCPPLQVAGVKPNKVIGCESELTDALRMRVATDEPGQSRKVGNTPYLM